MPEQPRHKKIIGGIIFTAVFLGLGITMLANPDMSFAEGEGPSVRRSSTLYAFLQWIWGIPGGIALILLGLLTLAGMFLPGEKGKQPNP